MTTNQTKIQVVVKFLIKLENRLIGRPILSTLFCRISFKKLLNVITNNYIVEVQVITNGTLNLIAYQLSSAVD